MPPEICNIFTLQADHLPSVQGGDQGGVCGASDWCWSHHYQEQGQVCHQEDWLEEEEPWCRRPCEEAQAQEEPAGPGWCQREAGIGDIGSEGAEDEKKANLELVEAPIITKQ